MSVENLYHQLVAVIQFLTVWNPYQLVVAYHRKVRELPFVAAVVLEVLGFAVVLVGVAGLFTEPRAALVVIPVFAGFYAINKYQDIFRSPRIRTAVVWWLVLVTGLSTVLFATAQNSTLLRGIGIIGIWIAMTRLVPFDAIRLGKRLTENRELPRPVALHVVPYPYHPLAWLVGIYVVASLALISLVVQVPVPAVGTDWWVIVSLLPALLGIAYIVRMVTDYVVWRRRVEQ